MRGAASILAFYRPEDPKTRRLEDPKWLQDADAPRATRIARPAALQGDGPLSVEPGCGLPAPFGKRARVPTRSRFPSLFSPRSGIGAYPKPVSQEEYKERKKADQALLWIKITPVRPKYPFYWPKIKIYPDLTRTYFRILDNEPSVFSKKNLFPA